MRSCPNVNKYQWPEMNNWESIRIDRSVSCFRTSGYYSYLWSEVLDADAFEAFKETGNIFDPELAKKYRKILSQGGTKKGMDLYVEFRGREPKIEALIKKRGLN